MPSNTTPSLTPFLWLAIAISTNSHAGEIRRCVDADGHVTFTSSACPDKSQLTDITPYVPERQRAQRTWAQERDRQARILSGQGGGYAVGGAGKTEQAWEAGCRQARATVAAARKANKKPTYDDIRRWNGIVFSACQGRHPDN